MKKSLLKKGFHLMCFAFFPFVVLSQHTAREFYQLKTYTITSTEQEQQLDHYLQTAYLPALHRYGIKHIGVFKPRPNKFTASDKVYVLLPAKTMSELAHLEDGLKKDTVFLAAGANFWDAPHNRPPFERMASYFMRAFKDMPQMRPTKVEGPRNQRVYELRSYECPTDAKYWNKVAMFNQGGEIALFEALGFNAVFYAEVVSGDRMPNLMYMTTFANIQQRDALWERFFSSDTWNRLKNAEEYKNNVSKADILLLYPTDYSDY